MEKNLPDYKITALKDLSHIGAKRYSAKVIIAGEVNREQLKEIILAATETVRKKRYYRSDITRKHFRKASAAVVWLTLTKKKAVWPLARTLWVDPALPEDMRPLPLEADEHLMGIGVKWCTKIADGQKTGGI